MATYRGFNTINQYKKFGMTDFELIQRDLLNAFSIRSGSVPGRPELGTEIWNFVFDPITTELRDMLEVEVRRIIDADTRLETDEVIVSTNHNVIIIEVSLIIKPQMDVEKLFLLFNKDLQALNIVTP